MSDITIKFLQTTHNIQWSTNSVVENNVLSISASEDANPNPTHSYSTHSGIIESSTSYSQNSSDPFEASFYAVMGSFIKRLIIYCILKQFDKYCFQISKTVKDIASKGGYSQLFKDLSTSTKTVCIYPLF